MTNDEVLAIQSLELQLLSREVRSSSERLEELLADDFLEFGSSGRIYRKADILRVLPEESWALNWTIEDFHGRVISDGLIHVIYTSRQADPTREEATLRSSLWKWIDGSWKLWFHQGTPVGMRS